MSTLKKKKSAGTLIETVSDLYINVHPGGTIWQGRMSLGWPRTASPQQTPPAGHSPRHPSGPRQQATAHVTPAAWRARCASGLGFGAASPSSWDMGRGQKGGRPLAHHALLLCGEPGSKSLIADLLFGPGCVQMQSGSLAAIY